MPWPLGTGHPEALGLAVGMDTKCGHQHIYDLLKAHSVPNCTYLGWCLALFRIPHEGSWPTTTSILMRNAACCGGPRRKTQDMHFCFNCACCTHLPHSTQCDALEVILNILIGAEPTRCEVHGQHQTKFGFANITLVELECLIFACTGQYLAIPFPRSNHIEAAAVAPQQLTHHFNSSAFL